MLGISAGLSNVKSMRVSSAWDPTKLADLAHWYKYNTGITLGTGDEVATWSDNYSDNHLSVEAGKVFKNDGDLDFDSNNGRMELRTTWNPGTFSAYLVLRIMAGTVSNEEIMNADNSNFIRFNSSTQARIKIGDTTSNNITLPGDEIISETWFVFGIEWDGSTIRLYQDSDFTNPTTASDSDTFAGILNIGLRGNAFDGEIREIVLINDVLSSSDRSNLMTHLKSVRDL
jgi:hypothetical protein